MIDSDLGVQINSGFISRKKRIRPKYPDPAGVLETEVHPGHTGNGGNVNPTYIWGPGLIIHTNYNLFLRKEKNTTIQEHLLAPTHFYYSELGHTQGWGGGSLFRAITLSREKWGVDANSCRGGGISRPCAKSCVRLLFRECIRDIKKNQLKSENGIDVQRN